MGVERTTNDATPKATIRNTGIGIYQPPAVRKLAANNISPASTASNHQLTSSSNIQQDNQIVNTIESASYLPNIQTSIVTNDQHLNNVSSPANSLTTTSSKTSTTTTTIPTRIRERRPDRAVYVPRARRSQTTPPSSNSLVNTSPTGLTNTKTDNRKLIETTNNDLINCCGNGDTKIHCKTDSSKTCCNTICDLKTISNTNISTISTTATTTTIPTATITATTTKTIAITPTNTTLMNGTCQLTNKNQTNRLSSTITSSSPSDAITPTVIMASTKKSKNFDLRIEDVNRNSNAKEDKDKEEKELQRATKEINRSNRRIIKQTFNSDVLEINDPISKSNEFGEQSRKTLDPETDDWESMFDDNGDCLDPKLLDELTASVGKVKIEKPVSDYKLYHSKQAILNAEEFPHVLEISNFPIEFKTPDLMMIFSSYKETGFDIKWVDDTHALAIFSSAKIAAEVLSLNHPFVLLKPLMEATVESRTKAKKCSSSLQPYRQRPETCAALARRLVTGALGVRLKTAREELENERKVLREAKERKLLAAKQRDEAWEN